MKTAENKTSAFREKVDQLANKLIEYPWNSTSRTANAGRLLTMMGGTHQNNSEKIGEYLRAEYERFEKKKGKGLNEFESWYGHGIIQTFEELWDTVEKYRKRNPAMLATKDYVTLRIKQALENHREYREFKWDNYRKLEEHNLLEILHEFDSGFRGTIAVCHKVNGGKYLVIETIARGENDKDEAQFYAFAKNEDGRYRHDNYMFRSFEESLFSVICPQHSSAMSALWRDSLRED